MLEGHTYVLGWEFGPSNCFKCSGCLWTWLCQSLGTSRAVNHSLLVLGSLGKETPVLSMVTAKPHLHEERLGLLRLPCAVNGCDDMTDAIPKGVGICWCDKLQSHTRFFFSFFPNLVGDDVLLSMQYCCGLVVDCQSKCPCRAFLRSIKISGCNFLSVVNG